MPDISIIAKRNGLPLTRDGHAIACPTGRIVPWGDGDELAYTGKIEQKIKRLAGVRTVYRCQSEVTLAFAPWALADVLQMLAV